MDKADNSREGKIPAQETADFLLALRDDLYAFCFSRVKERELAEEITQETYLRYLKASDESEIDNPRGYIFRIAFNLTINHFRKQKIRVIETAVDMDEEKTPGREVSPEEWLRYKQFRDRFNKLFGDLSQRQQKIFYLRRMEGLTTAEIARQQNISRRMVQKYMAQVMKHFHNGLDKT